MNKLNNEELNTLCNSKGNPELVKQALLKEAMTNDSCLRNVKRNCGKDTLKQIASELANAQKKLPKKEAGSVIIH